MDTAAEASLGSLFEHRLRLVHELCELVVGEAADRCPWIDALVEERLASVDVADAGDDGLIEEDLADGLVLRMGPSPSQNLVEFELRREDVGTEPPQSRMGPLVVVPHELDDWRVEAHREPLAAFDDDARLEGRPSPPHTLRVDVP